MDEMLRLPLSVIPKDDAPGRKMGGWNTVCGIKVDLFLS